MRSTAGLTNPARIRWAIVAGSLAAAGDAAAQTVTVPFAELSGYAVPIPPWAIVVLAVVVAAAGAIALRDRLATSIERLRGAPLGALLLALILGAGTSGAWIPRVFAIVGATSFDLELPGPTVSPVLAVGVDVTVRNATGIPVTLGTPTVSVPYALAAPVGAPACAAGLVLPPAADCFLQVVLPTGPTNQAPQVDAGANQNNVLGQAAQLSGSASDDGKPASPGTLTTTWAYVSGPVGVTFDDEHSPVTSATFYTPGTYTLRLSASDGEFTSTSDTQVTVATAAPLMRPVADRTIPLGTRFRVALSASDGNALGTLAFSLPTAPSGATLGPSPIVDWTPTAAQLGSNTFTARVQNGSGQFATTTFHVTVTNANRPPVLAAQPDATVPVGTPFARTLTATDPDAGNILTFALMSGPPGMQLNGANLSWATGGVAPGAYPVTVKVTDNVGAFDAALFVIAVVPASPPVANDDRYAVAIGALLAVPFAGVLANDFGPGGALSATKTSDPDIGSLSAFDVNGGFTYQAPSAAALELLDPTVHSYFGPNGSIDIGYYPPLVADLDGDGKPEVVIWDGDNMYAYTVATGALLFSAGGASLPAPYNGCAMYGRGASRFAVADIDDSGLPSIVMGVQCAADNFDYIYHAQAGGSRVIAISYDPSPGNATHWKVKWMSAPLSPQVPLVPGDGHLWVPFQGMSSDVAFTIARLAAADKPTILFGQTYGSSYCGQVIPGKTDQYCRIVFAVDGLDGTLKAPYYSAPSEPASVGGYNFRAAGSFPAPIIADFDDSGELSLIYEGTWWALNGTVKRQFDGTAATAPATIDSVVADLDGDGKMEVIALDLWGTSGVGSVKAWKLDGTLLWSLPFPRTTVVSKLTVADIDRDGKPDILFALYHTLYAINANGQIKWIRQIDIPGEDWLSPYTENDTPVYDLDGDGIPEIVVQVSKNNLLFLSGVTGETQATWTYPNNADHSGQSVRTPIIADLDGSGHASVGFYRDVNLNFTDFFVVLKSNNTPWVAAPKHLNQRAYWETNFVVDATHNNTVPLTYARQADDPITNVFGVQPQAPYPAPPKSKLQTSFTYHVSAGAATSPDATVTIDLIPPNRPPKFTSRAPSRCLDFGPTEYQPTASDPDIGDTLSFTLVAGDLPYQDFNPATGRIGYVCGFAYGSGRTATLVVTDSHGASAFQSFGIEPSSGSASVPDVVGKAQADAASDITNASFAVGDITQANSDTASGEVIAQFPTAGSSVVLGERIDFVVSKGPLPQPVPDVVGTTEGAAVAALGAFGFTANPTHAYSNTVPAGTIMGQSPAAGTLLAPIPANPVALTISAGTGLALRLDTIALQAGNSLPLHTVAIALDGTESPFLAVNYSITAGAGAAGAAPAIVAATMTTSATTRGSYAVTATENGGTGRTATALVQVWPGDTGASNGYWARFARFGEALAQYANATPALQTAALANDKAAILALVGPIRAKLAQADLKTLRTADPWVPEAGFLPTTADVAAAGFARTAEDQLFIAKAKELAALMAVILARLDPADPSTAQELTADLVQAEHLATLLGDANPTIAGLAGARPAIAAIGAAFLPQVLDGWLAALADRASKSAKAPPKLSLPTVLITVAAIGAVGAMGLAVFHKLSSGQGGAYQEIVAVKNQLKATFQAGEAVIVTAGNSVPHYRGMPTGIDANGLYLDGKLPENFTAILLSSADQAAATTILNAITGAGGAPPASGPELHGVLAVALAQMAAPPANGSRAWENHPNELMACGVAVPSCSGLIFDAGLEAHIPCTNTFLTCLEKTIAIVWDQTGAFSVSEPFDMLPAE